MPSRYYWHHCLLRGRTAKKAFAEGVPFTVNVRAAPQKRTATHRIGYPIHVGHKRPKPIRGNYARSLTPLLYRIRVIPKEGAAT